MQQLLSSLALALFVGASPIDPLDGGSFVTLSGRRLSRFQKTGGASEARNNIAVHLSTKVFTRDLDAWEGSKRLVVIREKGVEYVVSRRDPYLGQVLRKIAKSKKGGVLVKGTVVRGKKKGKAKWVVRIKSMQKYGKRPRGRSEAPRVDEPRMDSRPALEVGRP